MAGLLETQAKTTPTTASTPPMQNTTATKPTDPNAISVGTSGGLRPPAPAPKPAPKPAPAPAPKPAPAPAPAPSPSSGNQQLLVKGATTLEPEFHFNPETMTVESRLTGLLDSNNRYIQQARTRADQQAAARGLNNSSIAVQAGEEAAIAQALPIASQDANTYYDTEKTKYGTRANAALQSQGFEYDTKLADQAFKHNTSLQAQSDAAASARQAASDKAALERVKEGGIIQTNLATLQQTFTQANMGTEQANFLVRQGNEIAANTRNLTAQLDSNARLSYASHQTSLIGNVGEQVNAIYQNPNMSNADRDTAIGKIYERWGQDSKYIDAVYGSGSSVNTSAFR